MHSSSGRTDTAGELVLQCVWVCVREIVDSVRTHQECAPGVDEGRSRFQCERVVAWWMSLDRRVPGLTHGIRIRAAAHRSHGYNPLSLGAEGQRGEVRAKSRRDEVPGWIIISSKRRGRQTAVRSVSTVCSRNIQGGVQQLHRLRST